MWRLRIPHADEGTCPPWQEVYYDYLLYVYFLTDDPIYKDGIDYWTTASGRYDTPWPASVMKGFCSQTLTDLQLRTAGTRLHIVGTAVVEIERDAQPIDLSRFPCFTNGSAGPTRTATAGRTLVHPDI